MLDADHPHRDKGGFLSRSKALRLFLQEKKAMHTRLRHMNGYSSALYTLVSLANPPGSSTKTSRV
jgi:hypothetical protein